MGVGAYTSALLVMKLDLSWWVALPLGGLAASIAALLVGYLFMRVKRVYFAMLTLFLGEVIRLVIIEWRNMTGGMGGLFNIPGPSKIDLAGIVCLSFDSKMSYYYLMLVSLAVTLALLYRIDVSGAGRTMRAIEQNDSVAESVGINVVGFRVFAWCVGCFFAGIAGAFYALYMQVLVPGTFSVLLGVYIVAYMIVGGRKKFSGAIVGAFILTLIPEVFRTLKEYQAFVLVAVLLATTFFMPGGLVDIAELTRSRARKVSRKVARNA
jgi:branched-chain amino acid transport system permease protein